MQTQQTRSPASFILASVLTGYPDLEFSSSIKILLEDPDLEIPKELQEKIQLAIQTETSLDNLRSEYIEIFDHSKALNPLYETEYGRERAMFKANELSDIAGFYRAFGFEMDNENGTREMPDHVSVEFEFYSLLFMKYLHLEKAGDQKGCEIVLDAQKKFLQCHLGKFVPAIGERPGVKASPFYSTLMQWCSTITAQEAQRLGIIPDKVSWLESQIEKENMCCGDIIGINK